MSLTHSSEPLSRFCPTRRPLSCGSSIRPDASMSCRFSKSEGIIAMSDGDQRSMHGTGHLETCIFTDSPGCRVLASWPSIETSAGAREFAWTRSCTSLDPGRRRGRNERLRGQIGVKRIVRTIGWTMGPPDDKE